MFDRILVPIDGSTTSSKALVQAIALARVTHGRVRLIHVVEDVLSALGGEAAMICSDEIYTAVTAAGSRLLADAAAGVETERVPVDTVLCEPSAARLSDQIEEASKSWGANLIVIVSHGRRGVHRLLLGSHAEQIMRVASVPVLLVRDTATHA
jgi:nucleotide-binding universal stress UspA family protein